MMRVKRTGVESIFAFIFIFAAFFATFILPSTASGEQRTQAGSLFGPTFLSSGYDLRAPAWPSVNTFAAGSVQFDSATYTISESGVTATILVTRTEDAEGPITVDFTTSNGTATSGQDYATTFGTLFWADGDSELKGFTIPITDDSASEGNETVIITLSNAVGGAVIGSPNPATLTIVDNETPTIPSLSINDVTQAEGNSPNQMTFTVTLSSASTQTVTVNYATADGTATAPADYTAVPNQLLTFNPGETQKPVAISINGDTTVESDEAFLVNLSGATNSTISDSQGTGTIVNDDSAGGGAGSLQLSSLTYSINENSANATITITRTGGSTGAVTVDFATSNGTATAGQDYTGASGTLSWADGDGSAKNFTVPILEDLSQENNETVNITLSNPTGGAIVGTPGTSVLTIVDNDSQPSISINDVTQLEGNGPNQMLFNVTLSNASGQQVTVNYSTENGTATAGQDYIAVVSNALVFNPGETSKPVTINIAGDFVIEPDEAFFVNLSGATNSTIFDSQGVGTLTNDDGAGVISFESATYTVDEGTPTAVITVKRTGGLSSGVSVSFFTNDGTATSGQDFSRVSGGLVFAPNQTTQTFSVPIINDQVDEDDETVNIALDNPTGGATLGLPINAILTIVDNDNPPAISINDISKNEGDAGQTAFTFTVTKTGQTAQPVSVNYSTANGSAASPGDYTSIVEAVITFNANETSKQLTVLVNGDYSRESSETFFVDLSSPVGAVIADAQGLATIVNDDLGGAFRFNSADYTVGEPGGSITVTVQRTGGMANNVTVNYATSNGTAIAGQDYTATSGTLAFDGGQTSKTVTIPINNDGLPEPDETFNLILSDATGGATLGVPNTAVVTISDVGPPVSEPVLFDYDGDGRSDLSVRRPTDNIWYILRGTAGFMAMQFGVTGDLIAPADYDGDAKTDIAVFRPSSGTWFMFNSGSQTFTTVGWGANGDVPVPADHDGDGKADLVVFRQSTGQWFTRFSLNNTFSTVGFGVAGDKPVVGDFDGDGKADIAVWRPSDNNWYILKTGFGFFVQTWGQAGDIPVPADYDGDGKTDVAVFRPSTGQWFRIQSTAGFDTVGWGVNGDKPIPADYDGDGKSDVAVFRPSNGTWYIVGSTAGQIINAFGQNGDLPTQGAFIY
jgi:hypothetical protein